MSPPITCVSGASSTCAGRNGHLAELARETTVPVFVNRPEKAAERGVVLLGDSPRLARRWPCRCRPLSR